MNKVYDQSNIFSRIIKKEIPANIILEDEYCIAFHDINPQAKIHIIIIPKVGCVDYSDFVKHDSFPHIEFLRFIAQVADKLGVNEYRLVTNQGKKVGQTVFHFHVHLLSDDMTEGGLF